MSDLRVILATGVLPGAAADGKIGQAYGNTDRSKRARKENNEC
jgi:hypothetical protein